MKLRTRTFTLLFIIVFVDWMSIGLVYPMSSTLCYHSDFHFFNPSTSDVLRAIWVGALLAACPLMQFFSAPILGMTSDQRGRAPVLKMALSIGFVGYFLSALGVWFENLWCVLLGQLIVGIGTGNVSVVNATIADMSKPNEKAKNFGLVTAATALGYALGPFLGEKLSLIAGLASPFLVAGVSTLINLVIFNIIFSETRPIEKRVKTPFLDGLVPQIQNIRKVFTFSPLRTLLLTFFVFCVGWSFYWDFISVTWIERYGLHANQVGNLYYYGAICCALSSGLLIHPVLQRFSGNNVLYVALIALLFTILPCLWHVRRELLWGLIPLQQYFLALLYSTGAATVSNKVPSGQQGEVMGIMQSVETIAFSSTPLLGGVFVSMSYNMPSFIGSIAMLISSLILFRGTRPKIVEQPAPAPTNFTKEPSPGIRYKTARTTHVGVSKR